MIYFILQSYAGLIFFITLGSLLILFAGMYFIFPQKKIKAVVKPEELHTKDDLQAIAGEDIFATQLDLARAYIETGKKQLAKNMLDIIVKQGSASERELALQLLGLI